MSYRLVGVESARNALEGGAGVNTVAKEGMCLCICGSRMLFGQRRHRGSFEKARYTREHSSKLLVKEPGG